MADKFLTEIYTDNPITTLDDTNLIYVVDNADTVPVDGAIRWSSVKTAIGTALGAIINALTGKTTPVDADMLTIADSAASNATKKLTIANLKTMIFGNTTLTGNTTINAQRTAALSAADDAVADFGNINGGAIASVHIYSVVSFPTVTVDGYYLVRTSASPQNLLSFGRSTNIDLVTTDVTGTSGVDGHVTVSVTNGHLKIENRTGGSATYAIVVSV